MSQWRRLALEAVPSCKRVIQQTKHPVTMWMDLRDEVEYAVAVSRDDEMIRQIITFALECWNRRGINYLNSNMWVFWECAPFGWMPTELAQYMALRQYDDMLDKLSWCEFGEDTVVAARQQFCDALYRDTGKTRYRHKKKRKKAQARVAGPESA